MLLLQALSCFTGNVPYACRCCNTALQLQKNLYATGFFVYIGNFIGAVCVYLACLPGRPSSGRLNPFSAGPIEPAAIGELASSIAAKKLALPFEQALLRGIFCNMLVILAVIMSAMAKDIVSKMLCCVAPVMAFVAIGFEHCVANMFLIPIGLFIDGASFSSHLSIWSNILPVTLGNIIGGVFILFIHPNRIRQIRNLHRKQKGGRP